MTYAKGGLWCAVDEGAIVGTIGLEPFGTSAGTLRRMFVAAHRRGASHGVGRSLLETLVDEGRSRGLTDVYLGTTGQFSSGIAFYEKNGFVEIAKKALPSSFTWHAPDDRFFHLRLAAKRGE